MNRLEQLQEALKLADKQGRELYKTFLKNQESINDNIRQLQLQIYEEDMKAASTKFVKAAGCSFDKSHYYPAFITVSLANNETVKIYQKQLKEFAEKIDGRKQNLGGFSSYEKTLYFNWIFRTKKSREEFLLHVFNTFGGGNFSSSDLSDVEMMGS